MNRSIIAAVATVLALGATFASTAEAGVRLSFGGPLGSFTARPSSYGSYYGNSSYGRMCAKKARASRSISASRSEPRRSTKAVRKHETASKSETTEKVTKVVNSNTTSNPAPLAPAPITTAVKVEPAKPAPVETAALTTAQTQKVEPAKVEPVKVEPVKVEAAKIEPAKTEQPKKATATKLECKRFVPSVGLTISVPCK